MLALRCLARQSAAWYSRHSHVFRDRNPQYGVGEPRDWKHEGDTNIYRTLHCLVSHRDKLTTTKELDYFIKSAVMLQFLKCSGESSNFNYDCGTLL